MSWASERKFKYFAFVIGVLLLILATPIFFYFQKEPTCSDGVMNQMERGIDCEGECTTFCAGTPEKIVVEWARSFRVANGNYDAVALIENPNPSAGSFEIIYRFKLYDENNILVVEKVGKTRLGPSEQAYIFEHNLRTGFRTPKRTFFEIEEPVSWERFVLVPEEKPSIVTRKFEFESLDTRPKLKAEISNNSPFAVEDVDVIAVLYDINDNAIAASGTFIDRLEKSEERILTFTWQEPFSDTPVRMTVVPRTHFLKHYQHR